MLAPVLSHQDVHTVNDAWGSNDTANHGTGLAGLLFMVICLKH